MVFHGPGQELAVTVPVPERQALLLGVPAVECLSRVGSFAVPHDMPIADELSVVGPFEAVLVRLLAVGKSAGPAVSDQKLERPKIRGLRGREVKRGECQVRRKRGQTGWESHGVICGPCPRSLEYLLPHLVQQGGAVRRSRPEKFSRAG